MVCWFAALFYLPRLFVYHAGATDRIGQERFKVMERKLYFGIATPALGATLVFGVAMLGLRPAYLQFGWMQAKLVLVAALVGYHCACYYHLRRFARDQNRRSHRYFRWFNEAPVLGLFAVVGLAVLKPF